MAFTILKVIFLQLSMHADNLNGLLICA